MVKSLNDHYAALGLLPGASADEVRSAYRRMTKLYHPDQDASLDAQVRYREIRDAYEALRNRPARPQQPKFRKNPPPPENPDFQRHSSSHASSSYQDYNYENAYREYVNRSYREYAGNAYREYASGGAGWKMRDEEDDVLYFFAWEWTVPKRPQPKRCPFSWVALPGIVWESVDEIVGAQALVRFLLSSWLLWVVIAPMTKALAIGVIFFSLCAGAVFRYYYTRGPLDKAIYVLGSLYYGAAMSLLFVAWGFFFAGSSNYIFLKFFYHVVVFYVAILPLWVHPILWLLPRKEKER